MRILIHDFAGHPFQADLSRALAARGHQVIHAHFAEDVGPKGALRSTAQDPSSLEFVALSLGGLYAKHALLHRRANDRRYGALVAELIDKTKPQVVLSGNTPLDAQALVMRATHQIGGRFVFWVQDVFCEGIEWVLKRKGIPFSHAIASFYRHKERKLLLASDAVVLISPDFMSVFSSWGIDPQRVSVIPNWAPIAELPVMTQENGWSIAHGLAGKRVVLYSGTLGMKHQPEMLLELAKAVRGDESTVVAVIASSVGAEWLAAQARSHDLKNLRIFPLQPFELMPQVLATGSVLVTLLEKSSGKFAVPSKNLTYLCAARPVLASVPSGNLSAAILRESGAGVTVEPGDSHAFISACQRLLDDPARCDDMGARGRSYAEQNFRISDIVVRFEQVMRAESPSASAEPELTVSLAD